MTVVAESDETKKGKLVNQGIDKIIGNIVRVKKTACLTKTSNWLVNSVSESKEKKYRHRFLEENLDSRDEMIKELQVLTFEAHADFRQHIRNLTGPSLDPLGEASGYHLLDSFPKGLPLTALKGYFGEIFAGIIAEHLNPFDQDWEIPAFPFRFHNSEYYQLEMNRQTGKKPGTRPGRFGDDFLAFQRNDKGKIIRALVCEAKCTAKHNRQLIADAHETASSENPVPLDYLKLVEILRDYEAKDSRAGEWIEALRELQLVKVESAKYQRYDLVSYVYGLPPVRADTETISRIHPHQNYTAGRWLESVETLLYDVDGLIEAAYQVEECWTGEGYESYEENALEFSWEMLLAHVKPPHVRNLLNQHCKLLYFDGQRAKISVSSLQLHRAVHQKEENIKEAFSDSGLCGELKGRVAIKLIPLVLI